MSNYDILWKAPLAPFAVVLFALSIYGVFRIWKNTRGRSRLRGQILLYLVLAGLFAVDLFLFLKRDGFHASWSVTGWLVLAAFLVGEWVGRWTSAFRAADMAERRDAR